jgi:hypothetical protein
MILIFCGFNVVIDLLSLVFQLLVGLFRGGYTRAGVLLPLYYIR